jgi:hypothetical protein
MALQRRFQRANPGDTIATLGKLYNDIVSTLEAVANMEATPPLMIDSQITGFRLSLAMASRGREGVITEKLGCGWYRARLIADQLSSPAAFGVEFSVPAATGADEIVIIQHMTEHNGTGMQLTVGDPIICYGAGFTTEATPTPIYRMFEDILPRATAVYQVMMAIDDMSPPTLAMRYMCFHS